MIDVYVSAPWYLDHVAPIWRALPAAERGTLYVGPRIGDVGRLPHVVRDLPPAGDRPILVVGHGDLITVRGIGRARVALGQHGAGQSYATDHQSFPGGRDQDDVGLFLVPNDHAAARTRAAYPDAAVAIVGCPKLDALPRRARRRAGERPVVALGFHWDGRRIAPELRPAFPFYKAALPMLGREVTLIGHGHPRFIRFLEPFYRRSRIEIVPSFEDVLRRADVYVCDNSSSLFEFASTGRGVVVLNHPLMRRGRELGLRFWAAAGVGVQVDRAPELASGIRRALEDPPDVVAARDRALDVVYQPRSGGATLAAAALLGWAASPQRSGKSIDSGQPSGARSQRSGKSIDSGQPSVHPLTPRFAAR